ncbi:MAG: hypothetical protein ACWGMZ_12665, partial [Thermoguttaceae bacterium]
MYQSYWGLHENPFRANKALELLQQSPTHDEALARMQFLVENQRRLGLLTGPSGSGKSLVLEAFAESMRRGGLFAVKINLLGLNSSEMLWLLADGLKLSPE